MEEEERKHYFDLQKNSTIWIYGAGSIGKSYCHRLLKSGYNVVGFLDKNANYMTEICGRKVLSPDVAEGIVSEDTIVIISLRNGLQQENVAEGLAEIGLRKLIYLPMHIKQALSIRKQYRLNYARLISGDFAHIRQVPIYGYGAVCPGYVIVEQNNEKVVFWCNITDLHTAAFVEAELPQRWEINLSIVNKYIDRKIEELYPYVELFRYLGGERADINSYMEMQGRVTQEQRNQLLDDRRMLYKVYEDAYKYEMNFFTESPSICTWNEKGYFNISDGMHRAVYLISKGYTEVPVAVTKSDFEKYIFFKEDKECRQ